MIQLFCGWHPEENMIDVLKGIASCIDKCSKGTEKANVWPLRGLASYMSMCFIVLFNQYYEKKRQNVSRTGFQSQNFDLTKGELQRDYLQKRLENLKIKWNVLIMPGKQIGKDGNKIYKMILSIYRYG
jgi:hypothetical protein